MAKQPQIAKRNRDDTKRKPKNRGAHKQKHRKQRTKNQQLRQGRHRGFIIGK